MSTKGNKMIAKFAGRCPGCDGGAIAVGTAMVYYANARPGRKAWHVDCARIEVLPGRIFNAGIMSIKDDFNEMHWRGIEAKLIAELEGLKAARAARLEQAQVAA